MPASARVAIIEDDSGVRESLAVLINGAAGFRCAGAYPNAETALKQLPESWPDIALMDINLPQMSGIDCVAKLKSLRPELRVLMLTVHVDSELIFKSLKAGADGYLIKQTTPSEILDALADVLRGGAPMTNTIARKVVLFFQQQGAVDDETASLTKREHEILTQLAKGYQYKEIADSLGITLLTVRTHIHHIYEKLHVRSRTEAVVKFLGR
ncbi:MAG TPA: response regulator transcription factor [Verrucomicrobiae bacterium]|nr:response regulator transcription factor [Verrucomicrobiae bacterium]